MNVLGINFSFIDRIAHFGRRSVFLTHFFDFLFIVEIAQNFYFKVVFEITQIFQILQLQAVGVNSFGNGLLIVKTDLENIFIFGDFGREEGKLKDHFVMVSGYGFNLVIKKNKEIRRNDRMVILPQRHTVNLEE